jgi:hypothetical protein
MLKWCAKQYNDIKGNLKWAILLVILLALRDLGKKMLILIPNFPNWAVWPLLFFLCLIAFVWVAKMWAPAKSEKQEAGTKIEGRAIGKSPSEPRQTSEHLALPDFLRLDRYPLELLEPPKYRPDPRPEITHKNKAYFKLQNKWDTKAELWTPLWKSTEVPAQVPLGSKFFNLGRADTDEKKKECVCVTVGPYETIEGWIGLTEPNIGDGLELRLRNRNTGYMIIPVKSGGKIRFAYIDI